MERETATQLRDLPHDFAPLAHLRERAGLARCGVCGQGKKSELHGDGLRQQVRETANYTAMETEKGS